MVRTESASILIKPASANCNIDCSYCFYKCLSINREEFSKGFMSLQTMEKLIRQAYDYVDRSVSFAFQGGEPTLVGLDFFRETIALQKKYNKKGLLVENTIQTNGLLLDEEWAAFLKENDFLVGLSLDGPKEIHDRYRRDPSSPADEGTLTSSFDASKPAGSPRPSGGSSASPDGLTGGPTFERVMEAARLLERYEVPFNILSVITEASAQETSALYDFYRENGFRYLQFIPCMDEVSRQTGTEANSFAVTPESYGVFLCEMFDRWYAGFEGIMNGTSAEEPTDIRWFSNLAQVDAGFMAEECGLNGRCSVYFVVEGDGSVYPCDFYCMDEYRLGTVEDRFSDLFRSEKSEIFVRDSLVVDEKCGHCPYFSLCKGGCKRWRDPMGIGRPGLNYLCPAYERFFEHTKDRIHVLGNYIRRKYHMD